MPHSRLIVCEKSSRWAVVLRRALGTSSNVLLETRSLSGCQQELEAAPDSVVAVEVTAGNAESVMAAFLAWSRRFNGCRPIVLTTPVMKSAELVLREAGAAAVLYTTRAAPHVAHLALRHLSLAPPEEISLREAMIRRLPWPGVSLRPA